MFFLKSRDNDYYVVDSFFPEDNVDYTISNATQKRMRPLAVIYKKRINTDTLEEIIYCDKRRNW